MTASIATGEVTKLNHDPLAPQKFNRDRIATAIQNAAVKLAAMDHRDPVSWYTAYEPGSDCEYFNAILKDVFSAIRPVVEAVKDTADGCWFTADFELYDPAEYDIYVSGGRG